MILALDVTSNVCGFAWSDGLQEGYVNLHSKKPSAHLFPPLDSIVKSNSITTLGVVTGPGSFTGIRSGIATAMGLKASLDIQVLGLNKFEIMLFELRNEGQTDFHLLVPARGKKVFYAHRELNQWVIDPMECQLDDLDPGLEYFSAGQDFGCPFIRPLGIDYSKACLKALLAGLGNASLHPLYIRPADTRQNLTYIQKLLAQE